MTVKAESDDEARTIDERIKGYRRGYGCSCPFPGDSYANTGSDGKSYMRTAVVRTHCRFDEFGPTAPHLLRREQLPLLSSKRWSRA